MDLPDAEALCEELARKLRAGATESTGLVGIRTGGAWLAERLHRVLKLSTPLGALDISFFRADFDVAGLHHQVKPSQIPFDVNGRHIVVVDDVLYTGRTVRAAMNELFDYGRPGKIELADRKSTRLNSSHITISYAVFCLKKKSELCRADLVYLQVPRGPRNEGADHFAGAP